MGHVERGRFAVASSREDGSGERTACTRSRQRRHLRTAGGDRLRSIETGAVASHLTACRLHAAGTCSRRWASPRHGAARRCRCGRGAAMVHAPIDLDEDVVTKVSGLIRHDDRAIAARRRRADRPRARLAERSTRRSIAGRRAGRRSIVPSATCASWTSRHRRDAGGADRAWRREHRDRVGAGASLSRLLRAIRRRGPCDTGSAALARPSGRPGRRGVSRTAPRRRARRSTRALPAERLRAGSGPRPGGGRCRMARGPGHVEPADHRIRMHCTSASSPSSMSGEPPRSTAESPAPLVAAVALGERKGAKRSGDAAGGVGEQDGTVGSHVAGISASG